MSRFTKFIEERTEKIIDSVSTSEVDVPTVEVVENNIEKEDVKKEENFIRVVQKEVVTEIDEFKNMDLSEEEILEIKKLALKDIIESDLNLSELIDLVLLAKTGKAVKEKNFESLVIREYVDSTGKITKNGRVYLEFDEVKERLRTLVK